MVLGSSLFEAPCGAVLVLSSFVCSRLPAALPATIVHFFHGEVAGKVGKDLAIKMTMNIGIFPWCLMELNGNLHGFTIIQ